MWDPPRPGLEPVSLASAGRLSTTAPPGRPRSIFLTSHPLPELCYSPRKRHWTWKGLYDRLSKASNAAWLLRLGHKRIIWLLLGTLTLSGLWPWNLVTMLWESPGQMERWCVGIPANSQDQKLISEWTSLQMTPSPRLSSLQLTTSTAEKSKPCTNHSIMSKTDALVF